MLRLVSLSLLLTLLAGCATPEKPGLLGGLGTPMQLTSDALFDDAAEPALSPDGKWLAFRGIAAGGVGPHVYLAGVRRDEAGRVVGLGPAVRVTDAERRSASPAFSPDGQSLLIVSTGDADGPPRSPLARFDRLANVYRADGWRRNLAAADVRQGVDLARHAVLEAPGYDGEPAWSPDGSSIAFASDRAAPTSALDTRSLVDLYVCDARGGNVRRLTRASGRDAAPAWSPDNTRIAFHSDRVQAGRNVIYVLDVADPEQVRRIAPGRDPVFTPDGTGLVYAAAPDEGGPEELFYVSLERRRTARLTRSDAIEAAPAFSGDGESLVFTSRVGPEGRQQVFLAPYAAPRGG